MKILLLITAVFLVAFAFSYSTRVGAALLIVIVLGMLLTARSRGLLTT